jgi:ATP-dependent Clp protease ATP-binding subunit ClpC
VEKGYDEKYGARPLRRAIQNYLEDALAEAVLDGRVKSGDEVCVTRNGDKLEFAAAVCEATAKPEEMETV